jgi:purine-binding chemotaxis protein CheW
MSHPTETDASQLEVERVLHARARALARVQEDPAKSADDAEALVVRVGRARYAVPLVGLGGVVVLDALAPLPGAPGFVAGLAQIHGHVLTIVSLAAVLGEAPEPPTAALLVGVDTESFGLGVSAYESVIAHATSSLTPPPHGLSEKASRYVEGVIAASGIGLLRLPLIVQDLLQDDLRPVEKEERHEG